MTITCIGKEGVTGTLMAVAETTVLYRGPMVGGYKSDFLDRIKARIDNGEVPQDMELRTLWLAGIFKAEEESYHDS